MSKPHEYEPQLPLRPSICMFHEDGLAENNRCMVCRAWREPCVKCRPEPKEGAKPGANGDGKSPKYRQISALLDRMLNGGRAG
jgi:hypothetical protein